jgi:type II secretory pathway pseudopilin PulG
MKHQQGSALIMSLVILMILTVLAVSAMSNAQLDEKISAATQFIGQAFQETKSEINAEIDYFNSPSGDVTPLIKTWENGNSTIFDTSKTATSSGTPSYTKTSTINYIGEANTPMGNSFGSATKILYQLNVKSSAQGGSSSNQIQGIIFAAPKAPGS